jgi:hypothetical protein
MKKVNIRILTFIHIIRIFGIVIGSMILLSYIDLIKAPKLSIFELYLEPFIIYFSLSMFIPWSKIRSELLWWTLYIILSISSIAFAVIFINIIVDVWLGTDMMQVNNIIGISTLCFITLLGVLQPFVIFYISQTKTIERFCEKSCIQG